MLLSRKEFVDFEILCDQEGIEVLARVKIVQDLFGNEEARRYQTMRCKIMAFSAERPQGSVGDVIVAIKPSRIMPNS